MFDLVDPLFELLERVALSDRDLPHYDGFPRVEFGNDAVDHESRRGDFTGEVALVGVFDGVGARELTGQGWMEVDDGDGGTAQQGFGCRSVR